MEYDSYRQVAWHWNFLFTAFSIGVIALVLYQNPYLYDRIEFQTALSHRKSEKARPVPSPEHQLKIKADRGEAAFASFDHLTRSGFDLTGKTWHHSLASAHSTELKVKYDPKSKVVLAGPEIYIFKDQSIQQFSLTGEKGWRFQFLSPVIGQPAFDQASIYVALVSGQIFSFERTTGNLIWILDLGGKVRSQPFLLKDKLNIFISATDSLKNPISSKASKNSKEEKETTKNGLALVTIKRAHGEIDRFKSLVSLFDDKDTMISVNETMTSLYLTQSTQLSSLELATLKLQWQVNLPSKALGPALVDGESIYVATEEGQVLSYHDERGRKNWEIDLEQKLSSPPVAIPSVGHLAMIAEDRILHVVQSRTGDRRWHFQLDKDIHHSWLFASRLAAVSMKELELKWIHKGWTLFAPCMKTRVCLFNPSTGQVVARMALHGEPLLRPDLFADRVLTFVTRGIEDDLKVEEVIDKPNSHTWTQQRARFLGGSQSDESF